jgi:hypothetical protein
MGGLLGPGGVRVALGLRGIKGQTSDAKCEEVSGKDAQCNAKCNTRDARNNLVRVSAGAKGRVARKLLFICIIGHIQKDRFVTP